MKRIIHVFGKMDCGGAETRTMEIYRKINREEVQFDFLTMKNGPGYYDSEIKKLGGNIYVISSPSKVGVLKHIKEIIEILKNRGPFYAVHAHTSYHAGIVCLAAYIAGVNVRIVHSRSASNPKTKGLSRKVYFILMRILIKLFSTHMIACGEEAGYFLYGKRAMRKGKVEIIRNAIDFERYKNLSFRNIELRHQLNIDEDTIAIGHVGSFSPVKNHKFLINILKGLKEKQLNFKMILVGDGKLKSEIEKKVEEQGLSDFVLFLGIRSDIPELMSMFDILLLPSFYEGLPGVIVEAQAAGTPCIISDTVTKEVDAGLGLLDFLSINNPQQWSELIVEKKVKKEKDKDIEEIRKKLDDNGFTVENSIQRFYRLYNINN